MTDQIKEAAHPVVNSLRRKNPPREYGLIGRVCKIICVNGYLRVCKIICVNGYLS